MLVLRGPWWSLKGSLGVLGSPLGLLSTRGSQGSLVVLKKYLLYFGKTIRKPCNLFEKQGYFKSVPYLVHFWNFFEKKFHFFHLGFLELFLKKVPKTWKKKRSMYGTFWTPGSGRAGPGPPSFFQGGNIEKVLKKKCPGKLYFIFWGKIVFVIWPIKMLWFVSRTTDLVERIREQFFYPKLIGER